MKKEKMTEERAMELVSGITEEQIDAILFLFKESLISKKTPKFYKGVPVAIRQNGGSK